MAPKSTPEDQPLDQGQLFSVETSRTHPPIVGDVVEGGVYPEDLAPTQEDAETRYFHEAVHNQVVEEQKTRNRRLGNTAKHSPLLRDGSYANPRIGDYLPSGFGPVTERNFDEAVVFAQRLETERLTKIGQQPVLAAFIEDAFQLPEDVVEPEASKLTKNDYAEANTQIKLEALRDDDRAGFLPTTHREKSQGYELLDYMEPGKHEKGVSSRLDEIFFRQQREMKKAGMKPREAYEVAIDSVRSVIREWGDYLGNARSSWTKLDILGKLVDDTPNPRLTLKDLLDDEAQGEVITQLIRYDTLRKRRDDERALGFDPLWVREDRSNPTEAKHKTVEDMFSHQNEEFMAAYVRRRAEQMTVGQIRRSILEAKHDQAKRGKFWRAVIESVNEDYRQYADLALQQTT